MQIRRYAMALASAAFLLPQAASADPAVEGMIRDWIAALDATPEWAASYRGLTYDAASDTATLTGLSVRNETDAIAIDAETISVVGYVEQPDSGSKLSGLQIDSISVKGAFGTVAIADVKVEDYSSPQLEALVIDPEKPFTSMMRAYAQVLKMKIAHVGIALVEIIQQVEGVTSRVSYADLTMDGLADGKVASMNSGPMKMEAPSPQGIVSFSIDGLESRDMDLGAFVHVYSGDSYKDGVGDMIWRDGLAYAAYKNIAMQVPGARISFGSWVIENFRMRQPKRSFADFLDVLMANPTMPEEQKNRIAGLHVFDMFSAFGFGKFEFNDMNVVADGVDKLTLGDFHMNDFSIDGLGEIGITDLDVAVTGQGTVKIGRFALGAIAFPSVDQLNAMVAAEARGEEPSDPLSLVPKLGFIDVAAVDVQAPEVPHVTLDRVHVDFSDHIGPIPTRVVGVLEGLNIPASSIDDRQARAMLDQLGYDSIDISYGLNAYWTERDQKVTVEDAHFGIKGMGSVKAAMGFIGLPRTAFTNPEMLESLVEGLSLTGASFTFTDDSIVGKSLDILADKMKAPRDKFRQQFADAMPFFLSMAAVQSPTVLAAVNKSGLLAKLTPAVKTFIADPGSSLTISLSPPSPVPLAKISEAAESAPDTLIGLLNMSASGEAGAVTPTEPSAPSEPIDENGGSTRGGATDETRPTVQ